MDPLDEILSDPVVTSRTGSRFQPKIKPCPKKRTLAPQLSTHTNYKKATMSETNSCDKLLENDEKFSHDCSGDAALIKSQYQLSVIEENKGIEDDLLIDAVRSDSNCYLHPDSIQTARKVDSMLADWDSSGSILPLRSTTDGSVGRKNLLDSSEKFGELNCDHPSVSKEHEAMALNQNGLGSTQSADGHSSDGKRVGESEDIFYGLRLLDDFHNQSKNDLDSTRLRQAAISNGDGDMDRHRLEIEWQEGEADMDAISAEVAALSGQPARKYRPKSKVKTAEEDTCARTSQIEISVMIAPSSQVSSCDIRCVHEASSSAHKPDGILNDSLIKFDSYAPVNQHNGVPINEESITYDSYGDILVDDFNSGDPNEMSRRVSGMSGKEKLSTESNVSQQQERSPQVGEENENFKTRKLRKQVSGELVDELEGVNEDRIIPDDEPVRNCDLDQDHSNHNETSREGTSQGIKASRKRSKPASGTEKPLRKRREANEAVPALQAEKRPKKFSHSTRRPRRQVNKDLLETPEDEIDFEKISFRDLIIYHEYKEKLAKKEATSRRSATNQRSDTVGGEGYNDEEETLASEQGRGTNDDETHDVVDLTSAYCNYHSFMEKRPRVKWSKQDTQRFYEAIRQFGTDFCMIQQLFPGRTRHQIKLKFKNEERHHPSRLSDALTNRAKDHSHFISVIEQLQEAASKAKHESSQNELTDNNEEEVEGLSPETHEEVAKPGLEETDSNDKEEYFDEVHSPLKSDESDDDPCRWDEYKCDF